MFYYALATKLFDGPVPFDRDEAILDVELPQSAAVVGDGSNTFVRHELARFHAEFLEIGTMLGQEPKAPIGDVALAEIQGPQPGAGAGQDF